ncbi:MAG: AI-2E family transporter [Anaerovoracaceae bacterium]
MNKITEYLKGKNFINRYSFFIIFTGALLYMTYFVIKNLDKVAGYGFSGLSSILSALSPLFVGLVIAYLINPLVKIVDSKGIQPIISRNPDLELSVKQIRISRYISIGITFLIVIFAIIALIYGFTALIVGKFVVESIPKMLEDGFNLIIAYEAEIKTWVAKLPNMPFSDSINNAIDSAMNWFTSSFSATNLINSIGGIGGSIFNFVVGIIVSIYLLADKDYFKGVWAKFVHLTFSKKRGDSLSETLCEIDGVLSQFVKGVMIDALVVAILSSVGLSILGLDFAVFIGIFAGVANVIPYFGPVLGMVPAFIIGLISEGPLQGIIAVVILLVVQQIDCNLIYPRVVGSSTGLKPLFVLLAVSIAGHYGGILGMLIAVPVAGIIQIFVVKWAQKREVKVNAKNEALEASNTEEENSKSE